MGHTLKVLAEKKLCRAELPGGPEAAQISQKLQFFQDLQQFVGTFSLNYL